MTGIGNGFDSGAPLLHCPKNAVCPPATDPLVAVSERASEGLNALAAHGILYAAFFVIATVIAYQDFRYRLAPNRLLAAFFAGMLLVQLALLPLLTGALRVGPVTGGGIGSGLLGALAMAAFPLAYLIQQFLKHGEEARGAGDVKAGALLGGLLGWPMAWHAAAVSMVLLGIWALALGRYHSRLAAWIWPFPYAGVMAVVSAAVILVPPGIWAGRW